MKKIFLLFTFYFLLVVASHAQQGWLDIRGTTNPYFKIGKSAGGIQWNATDSSYYVVTPTDSFKIIRASFDPSKTYNWAGQLRFLNNIYQDSGKVLSSSNFVSGWAGAGWRIDYGIADTGKATVETDNLFVRGSFSVYETLIRQVRGSNGNIFITSAGKVNTVGAGGGGKQWVLLEDPNNTHANPFAVGDLIKAQRYDLNGTTLIHNVEATIDSIDAAIGNRILVSFYTLGSPPGFQNGEEIVRVGNTTNASRQSSIYFAADDANSPFMDMITGVNSWPVWNSASKTKLRIGNKEGITSAIFGALHGYGLYAKGGIELENGYLAMSDSGYVKAGKINYADTTKGFYIGNDAGIPKMFIGNAAKYIKWTGTTLDIKGNVTLDNQSSISISGFNNDAGYITSGDIPPIPQSFYQSSEPTGMITGDFWFNTTAGVMRMKRYNGTSWASSPYVSVYMDANGLYAGSITAGQITTGTMDATMTVSGTIQTAGDGSERVKLNGYTVGFWNNANNYRGGLSYYAGDILGLQLLAAGDLSIVSDGDILFGGATNILMGQSDVKFGSNSTTIIDWNGQITKVNNLAASSYTGRALVSDGTSYTPTAISQFPGFGTTGTTACVGNDARLSDARTPISHNNTYHSEAYQTAAQVTAIIEAWASAHSITIEYKDWSGANQALDVVNF